MKLIGNILRWIWRTFWGLIWLSMVLLACGLGLLFYFQQEAASDVTNFSSRSAIDGQRTV